MTRDILGYAFVGLWKTPLSTVPVFDEIFSRGLFGDPYTTNNVLTAEGLMTMKPAGLGKTMSSFLINNLKIQASGGKLDELHATLSKAYDKMKENSIPFVCAGYGVNIEFVFSGLTENSTEWLAGRFFSVYNNTNRKTFMKDAVLEFAYENGNKMTIQMQPRLNDPNAIYVVASHHRAENFSVSNAAIDLTDQVNMSIQLMEQEIFKPIGL